MRVPIPIAIFLLLATPAGVWFWGTRGIDFLATPSAQKLEITRQLAMATLPSGIGNTQQPGPRASRNIDTGPPRRIQTKPPNPADYMDRNPSLDTFTNLAPKGSRHLIELSTLIEASGDRLRTLLVWERVIDSTKPQQAHLDAAIASVKRLRSKVPPWSSGHATVPLVVRITITASLEERVKPILEQLPKDLAAASHGVLNPTVALTVLPPPKKPATTRRSSRTKTQPPSVSLAFTGAGDDPRATDTLSFPVTKPDTLRTELYRNVFKLAAKRLDTDKSHTAISSPAKNEPPLDSLSFRITRLRWFKLATALNEPKSPPPP